MIFSILALVIGVSGSQPGLPISLGYQLDPDFQSTLEEEATLFAGAWTDKDAAALRDRMVATGIRLHLPEEEHVLIRPRQAQAALEEFLSRYGDGEASLSRVSLAGDEGKAGFAEIRWQTTSPGLSEAVTFTVFLGYSLNDERWTVTEIRVLM